ncbi:MAG: hypothetical protein JEZ14_02765 [Marinilabiliaceae bacterium]|nr:hypothetical protein [Marinilabiliaceae bacterium]
MKSTTSVKIAGGFSFFFFLFHIPFYWMFDWKHNLSCLSPENWAIMMCFNIITIVLLLFMSYASLLQTAEMVHTRLGKTFLLFSAWFYFFRITAEFLFFDAPDPIVSTSIITLCLIPALGYSIPLFQRSPKDKDLSSL